MLKLLMEALPCSLIWKCYAYLPPSQDLFPQAIIIPSSFLYRGDHQACQRVKNTANVMEPHNLHLTGDGRTHIVGIWQLMQTMFEQGDTTFKAWQHIVTKIEPFLRPLNSSA